MRAGMRWLARSVPRHWLLRPVLLISCDGTVTVASFWLAMLLRFEGSIPDSYLMTLPAFALLLVCERVLVSIAFRLHQWSFRFSSLMDGARIAMAAWAKIALAAASPGWLIGAYRSASKPCSAFAPTASAETPTWMCPSRIM